MLLKNNIHVIVVRNLNLKPKLLVNEVHCQGITEGMLPKCRTALVLNFAQCVLYSCG